MWLTGRLWTPPPERTVSFSVAWWEEEAHSRMERAVVSSGRLRRGRTSQELQWTTSGLMECKWTYSGVGGGFGAGDRHYGAELVGGEGGTPPA